MKFETLTKAVYTDNGEFLKKISCPYLVTLMSIVTFCRLEE
jgi:hypothetical protein